ncbi:uncharacterized protein LOC135195396 [Macrobrachium nipponense]|uniref:uncharacterized protein LOC135195396 n=1 Tax=Macrobrachium nipponense TaxID=159736 RepID=UPI0030C85532
MSPFLCQNSNHDQGKEFVNSVSTEMHRLTGVHQRLTSTYHPQANGFIEKQNETIKRKLLKVLQRKPDGWPRCLEPLLFAHRATVHRSTKMTPFFLMYGRHPILSVDVAIFLDSDDTTVDNSNSIHEDDEEIWEFDEDEVMKLTEGMLNIKEKTHDAAHNINGPGNILFTENSHLISLVHLKNKYTITDILAKKKL